MNRPCGAVQLEIEALYDEKSGPAFRCDLLSKTSCDDACDDAEMFARHELASYRDSAAVTVHWSDADGTASKAEGRVLRVSAAAQVVATGVCVVPDCLQPWEKGRAQGLTFSMTK